MRSSGLARVLAPLALVLVLLAVFLIVRSDSDGSSSETPATATTSTGSSRTTTTAARRRSRARTYTVRANDTLSAIAERTGVSVDRLQTLNPKVDAGALQTGQRLKLRG